MSQHFLLSPAARTLSLMALCQLSDEAAYDLFRRLRWADTDGSPVCPGCDCPVAYVYRCRRLFKCKACHRQFSVTSGTLFASRKLPFQVLLLAIGLFVNAAKGISSLQVSRDLDIHAKTAFVLLHKFRCGLLASTAATALNGVVEIDGGWFGGHIRPRNHRVERIDRRRRRHQNGKRLSNRPDPMKLFLLKMFTWWNGQTFGTQLWTWRFGELVGEDEQGNRYFRTRGRKIDPALGFERRWVVYNGYAEASRIPPSWHGWIHHTVDVAPTEESYKPHEWEKPHIPNMTGTPAAYRPPGSTLASGRRPKATGDYQPWTPGN